MTSRCRSHQDLPCFPLSERTLLPSLIWPFIHRVPKLRQDPIMLRYWSVLIISFCVSLVSATSGSPTLADRCPVSKQDAAVKELEAELSNAQLSLAFAADKISHLRELEKWEQEMLSNLQDKSRTARSVSSDMDEASCDSREHLRLGNGSSEAEGRLEVKVGDVWMNVCENGWSSSSAKLVCSMLGFPGRDAVATGSHVFGNGRLPVMPQSGTCRSSAGVICRDQESYQLRVVNGSNPHEGRVEILVAGQWGKVCSGSWDHNDAKVVCRMLGLQGDNAVATGGTLFGQGDGPFWMANMNCNGKENHLLSCPSSYPVGYSFNCNSNAVAGVICESLIKYQVRLVNGSNYAEGRVEVKIGGHWSSIYDAYWDTADAQVVCRMLGYKWQGAVAKINSFFGKGTGTVYIGYVNCVGNEDHLLRCPMTSPLGTLTTSHNDDAGVICPL